MTAIWRSRWWNGPRNWPAIPMPGPGMLRFWCAPAACWPAASTGCRSRGKNIATAKSGSHDLCRTHAEQRAITLARGGDGWRALVGSKLVYVRLEADDSVRLEMPHFCARCSRLALSLGVAEWIFALSDGLVGYSSIDYDEVAQLRW